MAEFIAVHLWQSTLILVAAWLLTLVCRRSAAAIRYWIWFGASMKFLIPLYVLQWMGERIGRWVPGPEPVGPIFIETASAIFVPAFPDALASPDGVWVHIQVIAAALWALGATTLGVRWFLQWRSVRAVLSKASLSSQELPAPVYVTSSDLAPGVFGVFRPVVILPRTVTSELNQEQLRTVLAHEVCHIERGDNLTAAIHRCVEVLFWFHPLVWRIGANLLHEREAACDESVIEEGHERVVYAQSILNVCRLTVAAQSATVAASTGGDLKQRVSSIVSKQLAQPIGQGRFTVLFMAATLVYFVPFASGVIGGAIREEFNSGPIVFDVVNLKPSAPGSGRAEFDSDIGRIMLKHVSLRQLISRSYPWSIVNGDPQIIDRARYDIDVRWRDAGATSERNVYRQLLKRIVQTNFNVQVYVDDRCEMECG